MKNIRIENDALENCAKKMSTLLSACKKAIDEGNMAEYRKMFAEYKEVYATYRTLLSTRYSL